MDRVDYYELLGVRPDASTQQIKSAYRTLAKVMHPDAGGTAGTFRLLQQAYHTLTDPALRAEYDGGAVLVDAPPTPPPVRRRRTFGEEHGYVPATPELRPETIPWWFTIESGTPTQYAGPGHGPVALVLAGWGLLTVLAAAGLPVVALLLGLLVMSAASALVIYRLRGHLRVERAFAAEFGVQAVFGKPGTDHDARAEQLTADLLADYLTRLPCARIFHGLAWPGSVFADIDHAVLCGRRLVLVESKLWLPGSYAVDEDGELWRNGHPFRGGATRLAGAVAAYRALLPGVDVRGVLVIYPSRSGAVTVEESGPVDAAAEAMDPAQFVREIGEWLAAEQTIVDRDVFRTVLAQLAN